jgi:hypothetical protein
MILDPEDEAFNEIERQAKQRKESVMAAVRSVEENKWIETNNAVCALLRQAHDVLAMSSFPLKRTWVGLTEDEVALIAADCSLVTPSDFYFAQAIEAKLKEKNSA